MNPIISMMNQVNPVAAMLQPLYNAMQAAQNPMAALSQMAANDNRIQQVIQTIQQNGGVQQALYAEAQNWHLKKINCWRRCYVCGQWRLPLLFFYERSVD